MFKEKLVFTHIKDNKYKTNITEEIFTWVIKLMDTISYGDMISYADDVNKRLIENILARIVASEYYSSKMPFDGNNFVLIYCYYNNDPIIVNIGNIPTDDSTYCKAVGVYYDM